MNVFDDTKLTRSLAVAAASAIALCQAAGVAHAQQAAPQPAAAAGTTAANAKPSQQALTAWRNKVLAHLNAHKKEIANSPGGVSTVAFSIDRSGRVLSAQILKSSGNAILDKEAVALTQRSSPVPAPPSELAGPKLFLKVPIAFAR